MSIYKRQNGEEQPYWPFGPFKIRLPLVHYRWEPVEFVQALILFVVSLAMIPLLQKYLGLPYEIALAYTFVCGIGFMMPAFLGVSMVPGWITPAIPVVLLYLGQFTPGPEAIQALVALQLLVAAIFLLLGITRLSSKVVTKVPASIKAGILLGAGVAAYMGELKLGGRIPKTPIAIGLGSLICFYMLFSVSFLKLKNKNKIAQMLGKYGMVPAMVLAIFIGILVNEYPIPDIEWGITIPHFRQMWAYLPFTVGFPSADMFIKAIPTAIIAYIIAFGDVIVGTALVKASCEESRPDEKVEIDIDRIHLVTGMRNLLHAFFAPYPGLAGPIWTAVTATVADRYRHGRKAMDSIFSGSGTFWISGFIALFILPLVSFFKPFLPLGLSLTMVVTGYLCIITAFKQIKEPLELGVAGTMAVVLAMHGAAWGLGVGVVLHIFLESKFKASKKVVVEIETT
ncbi:xanthine/uracil/vitamin C permease [Desulfobacula phenolica]|uniref:Sulfate permease, MFS superfamily n=1 Tax=Desulfobacula phenolica TaxID=90732 RepID=A0A1H2HSD3_9BACT|nr:xanthine/uracil/vitamin C permease [Desulfobacula phenolica]SDU34793.1 Sulfate permease, MFS superfamily [Desulfobacula phenolica]